MNAAWIALACAAAIAVVGVIVTLPRGDFAGHVEQAIDLANSSGDPAPVWVVSVDGLDEHWLTGPFATERDATVLARDLRARGWNALPEQVEPVRWAVAL